MEIKKEEIKRMSIQEFREKGYLQELNRRFLHPLGLALEVIKGDNTEILGGIWDFREDPEGMLYDIANSDPERISKFEEKQKFIDSEIEKRRYTRERLLGSIIEPIKRDYVNTSNINKSGSQDKR